MQSNLRVFFSNGTNTIRNIQCVTKHQHRNIFNQTPSIQNEGKKNIHAIPKETPCDVQDLTTIMADHVANFSFDELSDKAAHRSKRMILDCIGVGTIGSQTEIARKLREFALETNGINNKSNSFVWGTENLKMTAPTAAFLNGCSTHTMDFDDTWHPATHPSGPVFPALMALVDSLPKEYMPSLQDVLVAFNMGIQIQGALLRCSSNAKNIPNRLHPPSIVGVMGSAAACSKLLGLGSWKCLHAMAIAASFAGAPMANAGTMTKPLHSGKAARFGLEAALLSDKGIEGNSKILDMASGFGAYYEDYDPEILINLMKNSNNVLLHDQDIAIKRYPCHLGMHWGIDAAIRTREEIHNNLGAFSDTDIELIKITAPKSKYINRPMPDTEHDCRHSFQFTVCSALLDGDVTPESFNANNRKRPILLNLLNKTEIETSDDNEPSFDDMYVKVLVQFTEGNFFESKCITPYGHWRSPLEDKDVEKKFLKNTTALKRNNQKQLIQLVQQMGPDTSANELSELLRLGCN